ncbi:MAG: phage portal protein [Firmicutes bacterium HGW-Firmicutes-16]|nr:MAG: phage portal protein [Firmicutes bacterium HGW-Firmicutes-16]
MGFLDNIIGAFSPRAACEREAWRHQLDELRHYDAGSYGRSNANWYMFNESAEITDRYNRDTIRARARDLERNSDIAQSVIRAYRRNVIGKGFTLQAKTAKPELNKQIEKVWKTWCKAQNCDVTGTQSFNQMCGMAVNRKKVDGGILFIKRYTNEGIMPFQLQAIEVDELDITQTSPKKAGNKVVGGIEYNGYNMAIGYYIKQYDIEGFQTNVPVYVQAKDVIFYYTKNRPSQIREISDLAPTITRIRDINEFVTAVSVKERIAACLAVFVKKALPTAGLGRGSTVTNGAGQVDYAGKSLTPGMIKEMGPGDEIQVVDPKAAATDATGFLKLQYGLIGAGQGLSYEATSRDMSQTNYASARQGSIEDECTFSEEIELLQERLMSEVYETFIISGYLAGVFNMPGFWDKKAEYLEHEWVSAPKKWIDPAKESNANKTALATGQKTFKQIAAENGKDWKTQVDDMAEVLAYGKEKGIEMGGVIFGQAQEADTSEPSEQGTTGGGGDGDKE